MYYINSASTISHQDTFNKKGFSETFAPLTPASVLIHPNYKDYIDAGLLRRMSEIIRMSVCCSLHCMSQSGVTEPGAIIIGTGLGCLFDTEKFLKDVVVSSDQLISPTPFIQSTHNTLAGQLSLILKNHNYNMTHTQNSLSFEHALQDALLCLDEGKDELLVGAADEHISALEEISKKMGYTDFILTSGASSFIVSHKKTNLNKVRILAATTYTGNSGAINLVDNFLNENKVSLKTIDLILYSSADKNIENTLKTIFKDTSLCNYQDYCGTYFSNSAFALHLGMDILEKGKIEFIDDQNTRIKRVLIYNNLHHSNLGLTLIESLEA